VLRRVVAGCNLEFIDEPAALHFKNKKKQHDFGEMARKFRLLAASPHKQPPAQLKNSLIFY
jgi:hypothetical protein